MSVDHAKISRILGSEYTPLTPEQAAELNIPPLTDAQAAQIVATLYEHACQDCGGSGRVDACRAAEQRARQERREERTLAMVLAAEASVLLETLTDRELADVLERDVLGEVDYCTEDFDIVLQLIGRLRRAGGGAADQVS